MVYCATSLSLATLEYFVHCDPDDLPTDLVSIRVDLPSKTSSQELRASTLPADWRDYPGPDTLRDIGSKWAASLRSVAMYVPSAVTPIEDNVLLNPRHPEMKRLVIHAPEPFAFDSRMGR